MKRRDWTKPATWSETEKGRLICLCGEQGKQAAKKVNGYAEMVAIVAAEMTGLDIYVDGRRILWRIPGHTAKICVAVITACDVMYIPYDEYGVRIANEIGRR